MCKHTKERSAPGRRSHYLHKRLSLVQIIPITGPMSTLLPQKRQVIANF